MMRDAIISFPSQFNWQPIIENSHTFRKSNKFIVVGMGGSHLAADILKSWQPKLDIIIHCSYGLPPLSQEKLSQRLIIASSYSGNTEEVVDAYKKAYSLNLNLISISTNGQVNQLAQESNKPYIQLPQTGIQPRSALGFSLIALLKAMALADGLAEAKKLATTLKPLELEAVGRKLANRLKNKVPIIYTSLENFSLAYNWKIKFNETGKIPAFFNVWPELNHNEMTSFDVKSTSQHLSELFYFIFLKDNEDHPRIVKRLEVTAKLYQERGLPVEILELTGKSKLEKIFSSLLLADWTAYYTAENYSLEAEQVPMVEEFKKLITQ